MRNDRLRLASIEITEQCNNHCPYCDQSKSGLFMPEALFCPLLDELSADVIEAVALGGGEPTLHPLLSEMLGAVRQRGLRAWFWNWPTRDIWRVTVSRQERGNGCD